MWTVSLSTFSIENRRIMFRWRDEWCVQPFCRDGMKAVGEGQLGEAITIDVGLACATQPSHRDVHIRHPEDKESREIVAGTNYCFL